MQERVGRHGPGGESRALLANFHSTGSSRWIKRPRDAAPIRSGLGSAPASHARRAMPWRFQNQPNSPRGGGVRPVVRVLAAAPTQLLRRVFHQTVFIPFGLLKLELSRTRMNKRSVFRSASLRRIRVISFPQNLFSQLHAAAVETGFDPRCT